MLQVTNNVSLNKSTSLSPHRIGFKSNSYNVFEDSEQISPKDASNLPEESKDSAKWGFGLGLACIGVAVIGIAATKGKGIKSLFNKTAKTQEAKFLPNIENIQSRLSTIFGRNISKQEANEMALKYQEIFQNENNTRFMGDLFEQLKRDYRLPDMRYRIEPLSNGNYANFSPYSGVTYNMNMMTLHMEGKVAKITSIDRENIVKALAHELKHAKQDEIMFRTDFQETIKAFVQREEKHNSQFFQRILARCNNDRSTAIRECETILSKEVIEGFKTLEQLPPGSPLRKKGLQYIENSRNYITPQESYSGYRSQIIESEAFDAGEDFLKIYKQLMG